MAKRGITPTKVVNSDSRRLLADFLGAEDKIPETMVTRFNRDFDRDVAGGASLRETSSPRREPRPRRERAPRREPTEIAGERRSRWLKFLGYMALALCLGSYFLPYVYPNLPRALYFVIPLLLSGVLFAGFRFLRRLEYPKYHPFLIVLLVIFSVYVSVWTFAVGLDGSRVHNWYTHNVITNTQMNEAFAKMLPFRLVMAALTIGSTLFGALFGNRRYGGLVASLTAVAGLHLYSWVFDEYLLDLAGIRSGTSAYSVVGAAFLVLGIGLVEFSVGIVSRYVYNFDNFHFDDEYGDY